MDKQNKTIAVIGSGLTGLTTAYYLKKAGHQVRVFEKTDRVGGVIQTVQENGFLFEKGPNSGVLSHPEAVILLEELVDKCELEVANKASKKRLVWKGKKWHALPSGLIGGITTPLFSLFDKFRILGEPFRKAGTDPEERLDKLVLRRMGKSFLEYAVDPFVLGIYAGDPSWLVPKYALPKLYNLEQKYGSFIKGGFKKAKEPKTELEKKATREIFSVKGGLNNLIQALKAEIGEENIELNCQSLQVKNETDGTFSVLNGDTVFGTFSNVISTAGGHALPELFPFVPSEKMEEITSMKYAKVVQFSIGFKQWMGIKLDAFGGLVPFKEQRDLLGVLYLSSIFPNRAPKDGALFSVFVGGLRKPEMFEKTDEELTEIVANEFCAMMGISDFNPDLLKIHRYQYAIPQYGPESKDKLNTILLVEEEYPGLILAGNIRDGIGMADRIKQGREMSYL